MMASNILNKHDAGITYSAKIPCSDSSTELHDFPVFTKMFLKYFKFKFRDILTLAVVVLGR